MPPKRDKTKEEPETSSRPKRKCSLVVPTVADDDSDDEGSDDQVSEDEASLGAKKKKPAAKKVTKTKSNGTAAPEPDEEDEPGPSTSKRALAQDSRRKRVSAKKPESEGTSGENGEASKYIKPTKIKKSKKEEPEPSNNNELVLPVTSQRRPGVSNVNLLDALFSYSSKCSCYEVQKRSRSAVIDQVQFEVLLT